MSHDQFKNMNKIINVFVQRFKDRNQESSCPFAPLRSSFTKIYFENVNFGISNQADPLREPSKEDP